MGKHSVYPQKHRPKSSNKGGKLLLLQELLESKPKHPVAFVNALPYKSLRKHVQWLSLPQQDAMEDVTLTDELECFAEYVKMHPSEEAARSYLIADLSQAIQNVYPAAVLRPFGSYPVSLSTFLSDVDVTVEQLEQSMHVEPPSSCIRSSGIAFEAEESDLVQRCRTAPKSELPDESDSVNTELMPAPLSSSLDVHGGQQRPRYIYIDLTGDASDSSNGDGQHCNKRRRIQHESSGTIGDTDATAANNSYMSVTDAVDADLETAYALADAFDQKGYHNNCRQSAEDSTNTMPIFGNDYYWDSNAESVSASDSSRPTSALSKHVSVDFTRAQGVPDERESTGDAACDVICDSESFSSDSLQRQADLAGGVVEPTFVYVHEELRREKIAKLQRVFDGIKDQRWVHRVEFRHSARVPIINLTHHSSVQCDISLNTPQGTTSGVIRTLLQRGGSALVKLSAFLKIYLNQLALDAPFTGGLGSYKLYVLLAKHIERNPSMLANFTSPDLGPLLLSFLKFYGHRKHLNAGTEVEVDGAETVTFERTTKVHEIQAAFEKAYVVLSKAQQKGKSSSAGASSSQISASVLAGLLNTEHLFKQRSMCHAFCANYQQRREARQAASGFHLTQNLPSSATVESAFADEISLSEQLDALRSKVKDTLREIHNKRSANSVLQLAFPDPIESSTSFADVVHTSNSAGATAVDLKPPEHAPATAQLVVDDPRTVFKPSDEVGRKIISGELALPAYMIVQDEHKLYLPQATQLQLGPFRSLAISARYTSKTLEEVVAMRDAEDHNIAGWQAQYNKFPAGRSASASTFSPLTAQGKLILAGAMEVPQGMSLPDKQLQAVELAKHCREGLKKLIQQRTNSCEMKTPASKAAGEVMGSVSSTDVSLSDPRVFSVSRPESRARSKKDNVRSVTMVEEQLAVEAPVERMIETLRSPSQSPQSLPDAPAGVLPGVPPVSKVSLHSTFSWPVSAAPHVSSIREPNGDALNTARTARWQTLRSRYKGWAPAFATTSALATHAPSDADTSATAGIDDASAQLSAPPTSTGDEPSLSSPVLSEGTAKESADSLMRSTIILTATKELLAQPKYFGRTTEHIGLDCEVESSKILALQMQYEEQNGALPVWNAHIFNPDNVIGRLFLGAVIRLPAAMHIPHEFVALVKLAQQEHAKLLRHRALNSCIGVTHSKSKLSTAPPPAQAIAEGQCWSALERDPAFPGTAMHGQLRTQVPDVGKKIITGRSDLSLKLILKHQLRRSLTSSLAPIKTSAELTAAGSSFPIKYSPRVQRKIDSSAASRNKKSAPLSHDSPLPVNLEILLAAGVTTESSPQPSSPSNLSTSPAQLIVSGKDAHGKGLSALVCDDTDGCAVGDAIAGEEAESTANSADSSESSPRRPNLPDPQQEPAQYFEPETAPDVSMALRSPLPPIPQAALQTAQPQIGTTAADLVPGSSGGGLAAPCRRKRRSALAPPPIQLKQLGPQQLQQRAPLPTTARLPRALMPVQTNQASVPAGSFHVPKSAAPLPACAAQHHLLSSMGPPSAAFPAYTPQAPVYEQLSGQWFAQLQQPAPPPLDQQPEVGSYYPAPPQLTHQSHPAFHTILQPPMPLYQESASIQYSSSPDNTSPPQPAYATDSQVSLHKFCSTLPTSAPLPPMNASYGPQMLPAPPVQMQESCDIRSQFRAPLPPLAQHTYLPAGATVCADPGMQVPLAPQQTEYSYETATLMQYQLLGQYMQPTQHGYFVPQGTAPMMSLPQQMPLHPDPSGWYSAYASQQAQPPRMW